MPSIFSVFLLSVLLALPISGTAAEDDANGIFLVAREGMRDPNFKEAVVLITKPKGGGPFGVIINRPLELRLSEIFAEFDSLKDSKDVLYFGGPVKPNGFVFLVHSRERPPRGLSVLKDIYFTGDTDLIEKMLNRSKPTEGLRIFVGYSGWGPGQLQREIARGDWLILPANAETVFGKNPKGMWRELIERAGVQKTRFTEGFLAADKRR